MLKKVFIIIAIEKVIWEIFVSNIKKTSFSFGNFCANK